MNQKKILLCISFVDLLLIAGCINTCNHSSCESGSSDIPTLPIKEAIDIANNYIINNNLSGKYNLNIPPTPVETVSHWLLFYQKYNSQDNHNSKYFTVDKVTKEVGEANEFEGPFEGP